MVVGIVVTLLFVAVAIAASQVGPTGGGVASRTAAPSSSQALTAADSLAAGSPSGGQPASSAPSPSPAVSSVAPSAASASPAGGPAVRTLFTSVRTWPGSGAVEAQIIAVVRNDGHVPVEFERSGTTYVISAPDGRETARGVFTYAIPPRIGPGEVAYFAETLDAVFASADELSTASVDVAAVAADRPSTRLAGTVSELASGQGGGLRAVGTVTNTGPTPLRAPFVGIVLFGPDQAPIAALYDLTDIVGLAPGRQGAFDTEYPGTGPIRAADVTRSEVVAFDVDE